MAKFTPSKKKLKAPSGSSGSSGIGSLMAYMVAQQKGKSLDEQLGSEAVATGGVDPSSGARFETPAGQDMAVMETLRKKAAQDAFDLGKTLPAIRQLKETYLSAYKNMSGPKAGIEGGFNAGREYGVGVLMRKNQDLRRYLDLVGQYEAPLIKAAGDSGNFSGSERESARKGLPKAGPNMDIQRLFMPDDPEFGLSKLDEIEKLYNSKYQEALKVAETGEMSSGYMEYIDQQKAYTGSNKVQADKPDARSAKLQAIKERFKQRNP